jgi:hypothetical protein
VAAPAAQLRQPLQGIANAEGSSRCGVRRARAHLHGRGRSLDASKMMRCLEQGSARGAAIKQPYVSSQINHNDHDRRARQGRAHEIPQGILALLSPQLQDSIRSCLTQGRSEPRHTEQGQTYHHGGQAHRPGLRRHLRILLATRCCNPRKCTVNARPRRGIHSALHCGS